MKSGVWHGVLSEIQGAINRTQNEFNDLNIMLTGGQHQMFVNELKMGIFADPNLVLYGLHHILLFNLDTK